MPGVETLRQLFDAKKIAVLQVFINQPSQEYTLQETATQAGVPIATCHRIITTLAQRGIIQKRRIKHLTLHRLSQHEDAEYLSQLFYEKPAPIAKFVQLASSVRGIAQIIMHGTEGPNRANIVIIGTPNDRDAINSAVAQIRDEDKFTINHLILENEQFKMLESMGQFSGRKTVLFSTL